MPEAPSGWPLLSPLEPYQRECAFVVPAVVPKSLGRVGEALESEHADSQIPQGGEDLWSPAGADLGPILIEGDVADPEQGVFYVPMPPRQAQQARRVCLFRGQAGDAVGDVARRVVALQVGGVPLDLEHLCGVREVDVA